MLAFAVLLLVLQAAFAADQTSLPHQPDQTLKRLERDINAGHERQSKLESHSATLKADLLELRSRLITATDEAANQQFMLSGIEATLARYELEERQQTTSLAERRREISELVGALYRLSLTPPEALIVRPEAPIDALRTALLLQQALPALRSRTDALTASLDRLQTLRSRLKEQRVDAAATRSALAARLKEIATMVAQREALSRDTDAERQHVAQRITALATQANDVRQLIDRIEAERRAAERQRPTPPPAPASTSPSTTVATAKAETTETQHRTLDDNQRHDLDQLAATPTGVTVGSAPSPARSGAMRLPAAGPVTLTYGDVDRFGTTSRGIHIAARTGTPVVAPTEGTIKFAGRFRNYGQILIVEHANGYHSLIAGLGRIDTAVGRPVAAGEPIGVVADPVDGIPDLYFELRRNGQPINPRRSIPALDGRGQG
ncbi:MAG: peptidoglycan DD-metalloendopeptidase family protein [Rhodospirillaceae bacterium]